MTNMIVKLICAIICSLTIMIPMKIIWEKENQTTKKKRILLLIALTIITYFSYQENYSGQSGILKVVLYIIVFKLISKRNIYKTSVALLTTLVLIAISDLICSVLFVNFVTINQVRGTWYYILLFNSIVCGTTLIIINIKPIKNKIRKSISDLNERSIFSTLLLFTSYIMVIIYIFYNISANFQWSEQYFINALIMVSYVVIILIFFKDRNEYNKLMIQYDCLFDYFKELEDSIDEISLNNHECKNQLAVLKGYIEMNKKKEALKYINDLNSTLNTEDQMVTANLKNIPKGGIKGLLYYKIITAKNKKVSVILDISDHVTKYLKKLTYEENKILSKVLGVYIDNAIEAVLETRKKVLTIEIYNIDNEINIAISNKFKNNNVEIGKISQKGYTTKGSGHGKGLYLINKIVKREKWFTTERRIIDNCYIQKITIISKKNY